MKSDKNLEALLEVLTVKQYGSVPKRLGSNAVVYTRVSSKEQAENNGSLDVQKKYCDEFANRNHITIRAYFGGIHESAKTDGRKEFQRMLLFARKNKDITNIIVFNYDRFSRTGAAAAQLSEDLRKEGIIVRSVTQDIDTSTASGRLQENFFHMLNNFDNRGKSDRTKINTREVMLKGYWPYQTPLGYDNLNKKHRACFHEYVITEEGKELKRVFLMKAEGKLTNKEIAAIFLAKGYRGVTQKNLRGILSNPFYAGYVTGNLLEGKLVKGKHPALVDLKTFLKANDILQLAPTAGIPKQSRHEELPLKIFAKDEISGLPLSGYKTKGNWYYKIKTAATPVNISAGKLNTLFVNNLTRFEYKKNYQPQLKRLLLQKIKGRIAGSADESRILKKKIAEKQSQLDRVEEKFILSEIDKDLYAKYTIRYKEEIKLLSQNLDNCDINGANLEKAIEKCLILAQNISSAWLLLSFDNKRRLQSLVFPEGILYNKKNGAVRTTRINTIFSEIEPLARVLGGKEKGNSMKNCLKPASVPTKGIEPSRPCERQILSLLRLPIPPHGQL